MNDNFESILEKMKLSSINLANAETELKNKALENIKNNILKNSKKNSGPERIGY